MTAQPHNGTAPTSFAQERFWFLHKLRPTSPLYHLPLALRLHGVLDRAALEQSLYLLACRHEVLRTTYVAPEGRPLQSIAPEADAVSLDVQRVAEADLVTTVSAHMAQPFDLEHGPLLRPRLFQVSDTDHVLALAMHHSIGDFVTIGILARELSQAYGAAVAGHDPELPALPIQYADYSLWQRRAAASDAMADKIGSWRDRLAGLTPLRLATDRPAASQRARESAFFDLELPAGLLEPLRELMRVEDVTPYMVGLAALDALLWWHTGRDAFAVGTPVAGRTHAEMENLLGCFINMLTLRADVRAQQSFRELLRSTRETVVAALADQDVPFERLVAELGPERSTTDNPFTTVGFGAVPAEPVEWRMADLRVTSFLPPPLGIATFDLAVILAQEDDRIVSRWMYAPELFDEATVRRWSLDYGRILAAAVNDPAITVSDLCRLDPAQRRAVVQERNDTAGPFPDRLLDCLVEEQAARQPAAEALRQGGVVLTYAQLDAAANRLAHCLRGRGAGAEQRVAIYLDRSFDLIVTMLAVLKAGSAYVPLDRGQPPARLRLMLDDSGASLLVSRTDLLDDLGAVDARVVSLDRLTGELAQAPATPPAKVTVTGNLAYVIYTSGSTGVPKGVAVEHRTVANVIDWVNTTFGVGPRDRLLFITQAGFDLSVYDVLGILAAGGCVVIATEEQAREPHHVLALLAAEQITIWDSAPAAMLPVLAVADSEQGRPGGQLRLVLLSGDWVPLTLPDRVKSAFPGARVIALGGATEASIWSNWFETGSLAPEWVSIPYGWPIRNARYYVLDERLEPTPVRVPGKLYIGGGGVLARGYHGQPALTAGRFVPDPLALDPGARMYDTGDRARLFPDGAMEFLGRADSQVKIRGFRVEPAEIEAVLARHPGIRDCAVVSRLLAAGEQALVCYLVAAGPPPAAQELRAFLADRLPSYMTPARFVVIDALPLTANGKCDRDALPRPPAEQAAGPVAGPQTGTEKDLAEIWAELLGRDLVGRDDNFFALGGHSLLALRLVLRARRRFAVDLLVGELMANPTLRQFALAVDEAAQRPGSAGSPLLLLSEGDAGAAVVLVHPVGGGIGCYAELLARLGDRPVYAFEARQPAEGGLLAVAAEYLAALREDGPAGPYVLAGWSMGGAIALEMAQQLAESGVAAPPVVMVDPSGAAPPLEYTEADLLWAFGSELAAATGVSAAIPAVAEGASTGTALAGIASAFARSGNDLGLSQLELQHRYEIFRGNAIALFEYAVRLGSHAEEDTTWSASYPGDVVLMVAEGAIAAIGPWQAACASLSVRSLPGGHYEMLAGQNARRVAAVLDEVAAELTGATPSA